MSAHVAFHREAGAGPMVLCIHPSSSASAQWRPLMDRMAPTHHVVAVDIYGHGKSAPWSSDLNLTLDDEAAFIEPLLAKEARFHLVGHSYGGAIALKIAQRNASRVSSLVLYEPALWGTLAALYPDDPATQEIQSLRDDTGRLIAAGELERATERFLDYWGGSGSWSSTPEARRASLMTSVRALPPGSHASFAERVTLVSLSPLAMPWLLMTGSLSNPPARRVVRFLRDTLSSIQVTEFEGLGHLGPITHPSIVNEKIAEFLSGVR